MMTAKRLIPALLAAAVALPGLAGAAEEGHVEDVAFSFEGPFGTYDKYQLQRGFQVFHQVCSACHGLKYLAFRDLGSKTGPAFPPEQVKAIAASYEVYDPELGDTRPGKPSDKFPANTSAGAPDLTLMAKARAGFHGPMGLGINQLLFGQGGPEYIYSFVTGFTGKEIEQAGQTLYENRTFPAGVTKMPPPLEDGAVEYKVYGPGDGYVPPEATVEQMAQDVAAFLMWTAEPKMVERKKAGFRNVIYLIALAVLLYFTNKTLWAPIKQREEERA